SLATDTRNRRDVADEIEIEFVVEGSVDRIRTSDQKQRVAICWRTHDGFSGNISTGTGPILDDKWLAEPVRQPLPKQAPNDVGPAARDDADDQAHRPRWIGLRPSEARDSWKRGGTRCKVKKSTARQVHSVYAFAPPGRRTVKTEPLPASLVTVTSPPIRRASLRVMARPSPVPRNAVQWWHRPG